MLLKTGDSIIDKVISEIDRLMDTKGRDPLDSAPGVGSMQEGQIVFVRTATGLRLVTRDKGKQYYVDMTEL